MSSITLNVTEFPAGDLWVFSYAPWCGVRVLNSSSVFWPARLANTARSASIPLSIAARGETRRRRRLSRHRFPRRGEVEAALIRDRATEHQAGNV